MSSTDNGQTFVDAAWYGDVKEMAATLATFGDVNVLGMVVNGTTTATALYFASERGKLEAVRWLLGQEGIDVNLGDTDGHSPLHTASLWGHEAVVEALITAGADVDRQSHCGFTALTEASFSGYTATVRRLIEAGARVNHANCNGWTALDWAQLHHHTATVKVLLAHRAMLSTRTALPPLHTRLLCKTHTPFALSPEEALPEVLSEKDVCGRTALHYAALMGDRAAYAVLGTAMTEAGVDTDGVDDGGYTAFDH
jgi:ankyrin repeat protein